jgi:hypothetical protein
MYCAGVAQPFPSHELNLKTPKRVARSARNISVAKGLLMGRFTEFLF